MSNNNKWYHVKVLWLHHRISAAIDINAAFLNVSVDGFNEGLQPHNKVPWEYCLALKRKPFNYNNWARYHTIEGGLIVEVYA